MGDDAQVVADEQERQAHVLLQFLQEVQHVGLDRDVERRDALVGDDEARLRDQRPGDGDALALTAGEGVREAAQVFQVEPALGGDLAHPFVGLGAGLGQAHDLQRLGDDVTHGHARAERGVGVLEDQLRALAVFLELVLADIGQVVGGLAVVVFDMAAGDRRGVQQRAAERGLAGTRLAHKTEERPRRDIQVDALDGAHHHLRCQQPAADGEMHRQVAGGQDRLIDVIGHQAPPWLPTAKQAAAWSPL